MPDYDRDPILPDEALRDGLERARRGDREALPALRAALDTHPEIWLEYGDLAAHAERAWSDLIAGPDLALAESLGRKVAALKAELAGPAPAPLERLLAARVAASWLQIYYADAAMAQAGEVSIRQEDLAQKRQARAHKNYLAAIAALATVRRLLPAGGSMPTSGRTASELPAEGDGERVPAGLAVADQGDEAGRLKGQAGPSAPGLFEQPAETPGRGVGRVHPGGRRGRPSS